MKLKSKYPLFKITLIIFLIILGNKVIPTLDDKKVIEKNLEKNINQRIESFERSYFYEICEIKDIDYKINDVYDIGFVFNRDYAYSTTIIVKTYNNLSATDAKDLSRILQKNLIKETIDSKDVIKIKINNKLISNGQETNQEPADHFVLNTILEIVIAIIIYLGVMIVFIVIMGMTLDSNLMEDIMSEIEPINNFMDNQIHKLRIWENNKEEIKEAKRRKIQRKKVQNNSIYINSKTLFHFATSKNDYYKELAHNTRSLAIIDRCSPYEGIAVVHESEDREIEKIPKIIFSTKEDLLEEINKLYSILLRPELVEKILVGIINKKIKLDAKEKQNIEKKLKNATNTFDENYKKLIDNIRRKQEISRNISTEIYGNKPVTGLGFGVITSSASQALLYQAMNKHTVEKQMERNRMELENAIHSNTGKTVSDNYYTVIKYYNEYIEKIKTIISSLPNKAFNE